MAPLDVCRQWIPAERINDPIKAITTALPLELTFATKGELATDLLRDAFSDSVRLEFVATNAARSLTVSRAATLLSRLPPVVKTCSRSVLIHTVIGMPARSGRRETPSSSSSGGAARRRTPGSPPAVRA